MGCLSHERIRIFWCEHFVNINVMRLPDIDSTSTAKFIAECSILSLAFFSSFAFTLECLVCSYSLLPNVSIL